MAYYYRVEIAGVECRMYPGSNFGFCPLKDLVGVQSEEVLAALLKDFPEGTFDKYYKLWMDYREGKLQMYTPGPFGRCGSFCCNPFNRIGSKFEEELKGMDPDTQRLFNGIGDGFLYKEKTKVRELIKEFYGSELITVPDGNTSLSWDRKEQDDDYEYYHRGTRSRY